MISEDTPLRIGALIADMEIFLEQMKFPQGDARDVAKFATETVAEWRKLLTGQRHIGTLGFRPGC